MYGCESWTINKAEHQRINAFELWCWRRLLRIPWMARRSKQSILKESTLNVHWVIDAFQCLILYGLLFLLPSIFLNISVDFLHQMAKVLKLQISISPSNELSGMVSLRINWFDPVAVQRTLKSLLQHHSSKALILQCAVVNNYDFITHNNFLTFS